MIPLEGILFCCKNPSKKGQKLCHTAARRTFTTFGLGCRWHSSRR